MSEGATARKPTAFFLKCGLNALGFMVLKTFYFPEHKSLASDYKFLVDLKASCTFCSTECRIWAGHGQGAFGGHRPCSVILKMKNLKPREVRGLPCGQGPDAQATLFPSSVPGLPWQVLGGVEVTDKGPTSQPPPPALLGRRELPHNATKIFCLVIMNSTVRRRCGP